MLKSDTEIQGHKQDHAQVKVTLLKGIMATPQSEKKTTCHASFRLHGMRCGQEGELPPTMPLYLVGERRS
ncbi:hypothetical protein GN956_G6938 [Arapaima gigas]